MLGHRLRVWANIKLTLVQSLAFAGLLGLFFDDYSNNIYFTSVISLVMPPDNVLPETQRAQNICITFIQRRPNVFDVGPTLYKCYTNVLCLLERPVALNLSCLHVGQHSFKISLRLTVTKCLSGLRANSSAGGIYCPAKTKGSSCLLVK